MIEISTLEDIAALRESYDVECKLAQGKDGNGASPKSLWSTYSAFANTDGGDIFLGLEERPDGGFKLAGIKNTTKVIDEVWTGLCNATITNENILRDSHIKTITIKDTSLIHIHVPRASRKQRPIYIGGNPLTGTYRRLNSADIRLNEAAVRRMLAEQLDDSRDSELLQGFTIDDLEPETLNAYRQRYANRQPDHPWNQYGPEDFLSAIRAYGRNRETGQCSLTRAGLLMFGKLQSIKEVYPNFMLDYQERPEAKAEARWTDRLTLDGRWPGNLFEFYQRVMRKLTEDLKIPFQLKGDVRQEDTPVHTALREALVNTLIHADFTGRLSVLIVRRPDMFGFRNPGMMRIPVEAAIQGGDSDCRNRLLQDMFRYVGLGENAGSGLPKIFDGWRRQHWRQPVLRESEQPAEQTLLELHTLSLIPEGALEALKESIGDDVFATLTDEERLVMVSAQIERVVDHPRLMSMVNLHPRDLSTLLASLVEKGLLYQEGSGRGTIYFLHEARLDDAFQELNALGGHRATSGGKATTSGGLPASSGGIDELNTISQAVAGRKRCPAPIVELTILRLCAKAELTLETLAKLLNRSAEGLRKEYLQQMIKDRKIQHRYPTMPNHPDQAYIITESGLRIIEDADES